MTVFARKMSIIYPWKKDPKTHNAIIIVIALYCISLNMSSKNLRKTQLF